MGQQPSKQHVIKPFINPKLQNIKPKTKDISEKEQTRSLKENDQKKES